MIGTVTLNPSIDQHWIVRDLVKDDTNRADRVLETAGGKGLNVSKVVRELGGRTSAYALTAGGIGRYWAELAGPLDVPLTSVGIPGSTRINIVVSDVKDRTSTRISAPGPTVRPAAIDRLLSILRKARPKPDFWVFGGSLPPGLATDTYARMIRSLQANGVPCVLDTDNDALRKGIAAKPFMIKPNEHEMQRLAGRPLRRIDDHLREARRLASAGVGLVVVSLGAKGALFVSGSDSFHVPSVPVMVRSRIGAGDSLIGGLLLGMQRGWKLERAARLGVAASTSAVMREGPRLCHRRDISGLFGRLRVLPV